MARHWLAARSLTMIVMVTRIKIIGVSGKSGVR